MSDLRSGPAFPQGKAEKGLLELYQDPGRCR